MLRVLHCPGSAGRFAGALARAERELGLDSWSIAFSELGETGADEYLFGERTGRRDRERRRWSLLIRAMREFDVVHFNYGLSLMPRRRDAAGRSLRSLAWNAYAGLLEQRDLAWLRRAGKVVVVTYQGDDARQSDRVAPVDGIVIADEAGPGYYSPGSDERKRRRIALAGRTADRLYAVTPDLLAVLPQEARYLPEPQVDPRVWASAPAPRSAEPLVVHAPSHRGVKGTRFVLEAVERLEREGVRFEFALVEGMPLAEARRTYERADLVVDQLLLGWYGALAIEAMALGKPVVAHVDDAALAAISPEQRADLPVIRASPLTVMDVLRDLLTSRREDLAGMGERSRAYVERWHDPRRIAARLADDYRELLAERR